MVVIKEYYNLCKTKFARAGGVNVGSFNSNRDGKNNYYEGSNDVFTLLAPFNAKWDEIVFKRLIISYGEDPQQSTANSSAVDNYFMYCYDVPSKSKIVCKANSNFDYSYKWLPANDKNEIRVRIWDGYYPNNLHDTFMELMTSVGARSCIISACIEIDWIKYD